MTSVDLNCDLGESFGRYKLGLDEQVIPLVSSCNIACGYHAGDPLVMRKTVHIAAQAGVSIGAHPGYPDLQGFGRRNMVIQPDEAYAYVMYQVGALNAFCQAEGVSLAHVKPHGALYNTCATNYDLALAVAKAVRDVDESLVLVGLANGKLIQAGRDIGLSVAQEFFTDRNYDEHGFLMDRTLEGSVITSEDIAIERLKRVLLFGTLEAYNGSVIKLDVDTVCVHGDGVKALEFVQRAREALAQADIKIAPVKNRR